MSCGYLSADKGSVIPIKVAVEYSFSRMPKMWDTGESCPAKEVNSKMNAFDECKIRFDGLGCRDVKPVLSGYV